MVCVRRVAPVLLLVMALPVFGATTAKPKQSTHPPRDLHRVGDHWTAYNPPDPSAFAPGSKIYTIKAGDTLWALAQQFYKNAYLWPQLWETNTWITDAHWIYPGDTLLVEGETTASATVPTTTSATTANTSATEQQPQQPSSGLAVATTTPQQAPIPLATEADLYCYGYIGDPNESMPNHVDSYEDADIFYHPRVLEQTDAGSLGDLLYVVGGTSTGIVAGETYLVVEKGDLIHPRSGHLIGREYKYIGQIRILCADETHSRAIVTQSCHEIPRGAALKPMPQLAIPIARVPEIPGFCDAPSGKQSGTIVAAQGFQLGTAGIGELVQIDLGKDDQLQPGDFLTVSRESPEPGQPRQVLGEIGILTTDAHTSTARIVSMRRNMSIGDKVEVR